MKKYYSLMFNTTKNLYDIPNLCFNPHEIEYYIYRK